MSRPTGSQKTVPADIHKFMEESKMLTAKENMREAVRGGNPDRFVNQYEAVALLMHPYMLTPPLLKPLLPLLPLWSRSS